MLLEIYQQETEKLATKHKSVLAEIKSQLIANGELSLIEEQALLHSMQVLIENAIGKARHLLKKNDKKVPVSAYDVFEGLKLEGLATLLELNQWKKIIGLRNSIVHEYMKVNIALLIQVVLNAEYEFVLRFLYAPFSELLKNEN